MVNHVFVWTFKDLVGATLLGMLALGAIVYGLCILAEKIHRKFKRRGK